MGPHPVISSKEMGFCIFLRFAYKLRLEMTPINHLLVNYLRGRLIWKRLQQVWNRHERTSRVNWVRLPWNRLSRWGRTSRICRGRLIWYRLVWNRLNWSRLILGLVDLELVAVEEVHWDQQGHYCQCCHCHCFGWHLHCYQDFQGLVLQDIPFL